MRPMDTNDLDRRLSRISRALQGQGPSGPAASSTFRQVGGATLAMAIALLTAGIVTGISQLIVLGVVLLGLSGVFFGQARAKASGRPAFPAVADIGMGTTVAA